jgi:vacuolar protein sorting-associated protein 52
MRSVFKHLVEAATCEFLFTHDFFKGPKGAEAFNAVFARTLSLCLENLENYLFSCYDAIGLLLMIKLTVAFRHVMQRRRVPVLDAFFDRVTMLLWPRFKALFDANLKSVRGANAKKLGNVDLHPHYVSRRYAEFTATCLALHAAPGLDHLPGLAGQLRPASAAAAAASTSSGGEDMLLNDVKTLTREVLTLLQRLAERQRGPRERYVFLINNYDQVLNVFHERRVDCGEERARFEDALAQQRELFVEEELKGAYGRLIAFVKETEATVLAGPADADGSYPVDARQAEALVREFAGGWKAGIEAVNQDVMAFFSNFRTGMEILKQVLTQLLLYYTRFQEIVKKGWPRNAPVFAKDIVPTAAILTEIRKYSRAF